MPANITTQLSRIARSAILLFALNLSACAVVPAPNSLSEAKPVSDRTNEHSFAGSNSRRQANVAWTLRAW